MNPYYYGGRFRPGAPDPEHPLWWCAPPEPRPPTPVWIINAEGNWPMAGLSGYCPESAQERQQREARERAEAERNQNETKESR